MRAHHWGELHTTWEASTKQEDVEYKLEMYGHSCVGGMSARPQSRRAEGNGDGRAQCVGAGVACVAGLKAGKFETKEMVLRNEFTPNVCHGASASRDTCGKYPEPLFRT